MWQPVREYIRTLEILFSDELRKAKTHALGFIEFLAILLITYGAAVDNILLINIAFVAGVGVLFIIGSLYAYEEFTFIRIMLGRRA